MRSLFALVGICAVVGLAPPAYGDPSQHNDAGFLAALREDKIGYADPGRAIDAAQAVCTCLNNGESGLGLVHDVKTHNPGFSMDSAAQFAVTSAQFYCPQQLAKAPAR
ncbi:DUF732 domain-containing protein [Mycobacterium sp. 050134]|uniref:DUF732 domain-containing protein n=1 Tax=Mycobacterium sp. 050134 TaxID=3096111 RepID=UPI002ED78872